jgi:hypothetical protein
MSAKVLAKHFSISLLTMSRIGKTHLEFRRSQAKGSPMNHLTIETVKVRNFGGILNILRNDESDGFPMLPQEINLDSHIIMNPLLLRNIPRGSAPRTKTTITIKRPMEPYFFWNGLPGLRCSSSRTKIQSKVFHGHDNTRTIQGKYEPQADSWQEPTNRTL